MKPIDFRAATWTDLQERLTGQREAVLRAWREHGPGTTAEVCARAGMSILSFRPRTTELFELGFVCLAADQPAKGEGTYLVRTVEEHVAWLADRVSAAGNPQRELTLR